MVRASDKQIFAYRPKGKYQKKSEDFVKSQIKKARAMGQGIRELSEQLKESQGPEKDGIEQMLDLFLGKVNLYLPDDKMYVGFEARSAKPPDVIFRIMGMLSTPAMIQYIAPDGSAKDRERQDKIEAHLNNLDPWFFRRDKQSYSQQALFWQCVAGKSYIQQTYEPYYWDKEERKRRDGESDSDLNARWKGYKGYMGPPFMRESLDPRIVFPIWTNRGPEGYVKSYRVQRFELMDAMAKVGKFVHFDRHGDVDDVVPLKKRAGLELPENSDLSPMDAVEYHEYIDDAMIYYQVGDKVVHAYDHGGSVCIAPAHGLQTGLREPDLMSVGLLWAVRNEIPQFDFLRTLWMQKAYLEIFPQLFAQLGEQDTPMSDESGNPEQWNIEPGTIKQIRGQLINALQHSASGVDFRAAIEMLSEDIDLATIPNLARGIAGAQQPGFSINQLTQSMRTNWKPLIESRELQRAYLDEQYLWAVKDTVSEPVSIFGEVANEETGHRSGTYMTLDPDDIDPYFRISVTLKPELPVDRQGMAMTGAALQERGHITWEEEVRDYQDGTNPESKRKKIMKDQMIRAWLPKATEDGMALGRVKLTNDIIEARGLNQLNQIGNLDIQALKQARQQQMTPEMAAAAAAGGGGAPQPGTASLGEGMGIPPTAGANPANPSPGPRIQG